MKPYKVYMSWISGPVVGFEILGDDEGFAAYGIHLLFFRLLITREDLLINE